MLNLLKFTYIFALNMKSSIVTIAFLFRIVVVETLTVFLYVYKENDKKTAAAAASTCLYIG